MAVKERMKAILESQQMRKLKNLEDPLMKSEEIENEYKCVKCRDMTFKISSASLKALHSQGVATPSSIIKELWIMRMSF